MTVSRRVELIPLPFRRPKVLSDYQIPSMCEPGKRFAQGRPALGREPPPSPGFRRRKQPIARARRGLTTVGEVLMRPPELAEAHIATSMLMPTPTTLRLPRPQSVPQRIDAEVGRGGFGAKGG
jgi:hypothetical protein